MMSNKKLSEYIRDSQGFAIHNSVIEEWADRVEALEDDATERWNLSARLAALEAAAKEVERDLRELHRVCAVSPVILESAGRLRAALTSEAKKAET